MKLDEFLKNNIGKRITISIVTGLVSSALTGKLTESSYDYAIVNGNSTVNLMKYSLEKTELELLEKTELELKDTIYVGRFDNVCVAVHSSITDFEEKKQEETK